MRFDTSQHMKLGQQMKLAPRMIQSMEILQMSLAELDERIEQELENNPTLERLESEAEAPSDGEAASTQAEAENREDARREESGRDDADEEGGDEAGERERRDADPLALESERRAQDSEGESLDVDEKHGEVDFERLEE